MLSTATAQAEAKSSVAAIILDLEDNSCTLNHSNDSKGSIKIVGDESILRPVSTITRPNHCTKRISIATSHVANRQHQQQYRERLPQSPMPQQQQYHQQRSNSSSNLYKFISNGTMMPSLWWKPAVTTSRSAKDSKIIGLKHYGLESPRHQLHNVLSSDIEDPSNHSLKSVAKAKVASMATSGESQVSANRAIIEQLKSTRRKYQNQPKLQQKNDRLFAVEKEEEHVRKNVIRNPCILFYLGNLAAIKVVLYYFITIETILSCAVTTGLTVYWYNFHSSNPEWQGNTLNFILVAFTLTAPMTAALTMAFTRREQALMLIADFRSFSYHLYMAHALWDWDDSSGGRIGTTQIDLVEHCDAILAQLIGIGDELSRFLSLPNTSRSRHRHTKQGRREAARTIEVAYHLLDSMSTQRLTRLVIYSERLKKIGLPSGEISRVRQYERFISSMIEQLRMLKLYRTPQAFRSFARIFTLILPPFYAPTFAQVARDVDSLGVGIAFGVITALGLVALFESHQILEDPFTAYLALDGIDVREEFEVLHYAQLINTRKLIFPNAPPYPAARRAALTSQSMRFRKKNNDRIKKSAPSPSATVVDGKGLPSSPTNTETTSATASNILLKVSSSSTLPMSKSPRGGDKYTTMLTANDEDVEVSTVVDDTMMTSSLAAVESVKTKNNDCYDTDEYDDDISRESDDTDDLELGTFIDDDDQTYRESIFIHPEQELIEPDRYSKHYYHHILTPAASTNCNHHLRNSHA